MRAGACVCACVLWALVCAGCASPPDGAGGTHADWRPAQIVAIGSASELAATAGHDCGTGDGTARYAVVRYHSSGAHSHAIGTDRLPAGAALQVGDIVFVNIHDCSAALARQAPLAPP